MLPTFPQAEQSASGDVIAVKDAQIAALQMELRGLLKIQYKVSVIGLTSHRLAYRSHCTQLIGFL